MGKKPTRNNKSVVKRGIGHLQEQRVGRRNGLKEPAARETTNLYFSLVPLRRATAKGGADYRTSFQVNHAI